MSAPPNTKLAVVRVICALLATAALGASFALPMWSKDLGNDCVLKMEYFKTKTCCNGNCESVDTKDLYTIVDECNDTTKPMMQAVIYGTIAGCVVGGITIALSFANCGMRGAGTAAGCLFVLLLVVGWNVGLLQVAMFFMDWCGKGDPPHKDDYKLNGAPFCCIGAGIVALLEIIASCCIKDEARRSLDGYDDTAGRSQHQRFIQQ